MALQYKEYPESAIVEISIDGKIIEKDFDLIVPQMEAFIAKQSGKIRILEIVKNFGGFDMSMLGKAIKFDMNHLKNYEKCAVVSDGGWIGPISRIAGGMFSCEIRTFKLNEIDQARAWLKASQ